MSSEIKVEFENVIQGFRHNNYQYQYQFQLKLEMDMPRVFFSVDAKKLLASAFDLIKVDLLNFNGSVKGKINNPTKGLLSAANSIAQSLLVHGGFPSFDSASVVNFDIQKTKPRRVSIVLVVPTEKFQNHKLVAQAYAKGIQIAQAFTVQKSHQAGLLYNSTKDLDGFVNALRRSTQGGISTKFIVQEAFTRGLPVIYRDTGYYQIGLGNKQQVFLRSANLQDSAIGAIVTKDKFNCIEQLKAAGIPTPISQLVRGSDEAKVAAKKLGFPVVLKPSDLDRGEGVFVDLFTNESIDAACTEIQKLSQRMIIENRVRGVCHRLLVFRDEVVFAFVRHPLSVVGDGECDIAGLISKHAQEQKNKAAHLRSTPAKLDSEAQKELHMQGFDLKTVLHKDQIAHLRPFQSSISGGHNEIVTTSVHPENAEIACRAARIFGLNIAGIDLISTDIRIPWHENNAVINEVNFQPQIGENTAKAMLDRYFPDNNGSIAIECYVGDDKALQSALERHQQLCKQGENAFLTSHAVSMGPNQAEIFIAGLNNLFDRVECFLRDRRVSTLIVVVQTDEVAVTGLPFRKITNLQVINQNLKPNGPMLNLVTSSRSEEIIELFQAALER